MQINAVHAFGLGNKVFGDVVVHPRLKTVLPSGQFFQSSFAGLRAFLLETFSPVLIPETLVLDGSSGKDFARGIGGDVDDAEVHPEDADGKFRFLLGNVADDVDEPLFVAFGIDEIDFSLPEWEEFSLMFSVHERNLHSPGQRPEADLIPLLEGEDPVVVGLGGPLPEDVDGRPVRPIGIGHFGKTPDDHLRRKGGCIPEDSIFRLVQIELSEGLRLEGEPGEIVAKGVAHFERLEEYLRLSVRWFKFKVDCYLHNICSIFDYFVCQPLAKRRAHSSPA